MYGTILLLVAAIFGFGGAPWPLILAVALLLSLPGAGRIVTMSRRFADVGQVRVFVVTGLMAMLTNAAFTAIAYGSGRVAASIMLS